MSDLFVVAFDDELKAEQVRVELLSLRKKHLVDMEEAVAVIRTGTGDVRIHHATRFTGLGALGGGFMGTMVGLMLLNPFTAVMGGITGAALGAITGALKELGIDESFLKEMASHLTPGSSALFILAQEGPSEEINKEIEKYHGHIMRTGLAHQDETKLAAALAAATQ